MSGSSEKVIIELGMKGLFGAAVKIVSPLQVVRLHRHSPCWHRPRPVHHCDRGAWEFHARAVRVGCPQVFHPAPSRQSRTSEMRRRIRLPLLSHNRHPGCATLGLRICHLIDAVLSPDRSMSGLFLGGLRMLVNLTKHPEAFDPETVIILAEVAWPAAPASHIGTFKTEHEAGRTRLSTSLSSTFETWAHDIPHFSSTF